VNGENFSIFFRRTKNKAQPSNAMKLSYEGSTAEEVTM